ncbi:TetR/AcrR family transcriptional regulator [Tengunoibacter tsumagoiensis]|uniref:TetR family transcriptional regulator n=1 Tax=Tengunoibacter tsumagoiensis TaxID=2014871 RepID=A0A402A217_9CHLR|nr:TetR family transcriptional regulator [Tengunoibacter tsumagoiensis]GCE13041.1 TetR family transcriptional regulator [Tengunoibacter tsumagoiensis]
MVQKHRRERDSQVAKAAIKAAAEEIFARDGFGAARVDAVAEASGYNKSLIFQYFGDKLGLYKAVVQRCKEQLEDDLIQIMNDKLENGGTINAEQFRIFLATVIRQYFDYQANHPRLVHILAWEMVEGWSTFKLLPQAEGPHCFRNKFVKVSQFLEEARALNVIRAEFDPVLLVAHILNMCIFHVLSIPRYQINFPERDFSSPEALLQAREQIVLLVLHGVMAPEGGNTCN